MNKFLEKERKQFLDRVRQTRISRLSRGNVHYQKGLCQSELKEKRETQKQRVDEISRAFYPEKYSEKR